MKSARSSRRSNRSNTSGAKQWGGKSRAVVLAACCALSAGILGACGASQSQASSTGSSPSGKTKIPITYWTLSSDTAEQAVQQKVVSEFNKTYPGGDVTVDFIQNTPYKTKIEVAMAAHHPPTIFFTWGGQLFYTWVKAGEVMSLGQALAADSSWKDDYLPTAWNLVTYRGSIYGVPQGGPGIELMFENKAVLSAAHAKASPSTWTELLTDIAAVKKNTSASPVALAGATEWPEMIWLQYLTLRYGGRSVFDKIAAGDKNAWDSPAILKAAAAVQDLARAGAFEPGYSAVHYGSGATDELMAANKAAFQAMGDWDYSDMTEYAKHFATSSNYASFPFPTVSGETGNPKDYVGEAASYAAIAANASPAQRKEALAFLKFATTSPAWNLDYEEQYGSLPVDVHYAADLVHYPGGHELLRFYRDAQTAPYLQDYWDQDLPNAIVTPMLTNIGELFTLSITPKQFVSMMDAVEAKTS